MSFVTHSLNILSLAAIAGVALLLSRWLYRALSNPLASLPGPFYTRFTRLPYRYNALKSRRSQWIDSLHHKYGKVVRIAPGEVSIIDLASVKEIHKISTHYLKTDWYSEFSARQVPNVFTMRDPHAHRTRRSLLAAGLSESSLRKVEPIVNANVEKAVERMSDENSRTGSADIFKWFMYMATDVIGELSFGESFKVLDNDEPNQYFRDLQSIGHLGQMRTEIGLGLSYILSSLGVEPWRNALGIVKRLNVYAEQSIARYEKIIDADSDNPKPTLFSKLYTKTSDGQLTRHEMIREANAYIVAGSDTTAISTTYLVYHVLRNPAVHAKLNQELLRLAEPYNWDDLRSLPYLNNVMEEAFRLCSAAPGPFPRNVPAQGATLSGYNLPGGTVVSTQAYSLHRDPDTWTDPETFNPDRWIEPTPDMKAAFMTFGAGTRVCLGMHLARDEMRYAVAKFFRAYPRARLVELDENMVQDAYVLMGPRGKRCLVALDGKENLSEKV